MSLREFFSRIGLVALWLYLFRKGEKAQRVVKAPHVTCGRLREKAQQSQRNTDHPTRGYTLTLRDCHPATIQNPPRGYEKFTLTQTNTQTHTVNHHQKPKFARTAVNQLSDALLKHEEKNGKFSEKWGPWWKWFQTPSGRRSTTKTWPTCSRRDGAFWWTMLAFR